MCGIAGFFNAARPAPEHADIIRPMIALLRHRGPDELAYTCDATTALAAARLAILDLPAGRQPMTDTTRRYWLSYNGEVYNYLELGRELRAAGVPLGTASDTEVVLRSLVHWGEDALARFNGGFALALYDAKRQSLLLARDRFGQRPLFYTRAGREVVFASECKSFLAHPGVALDFDPEALRTSFTLWTPLPTQSCFRGIHQVAPGTCLRFTADGGEHQRRYFEYPIPSDRERLHDPQEAAEALRAALREAVRLRLRSDVEVACYLSGGLDSSVTTQLALALCPRPVRSFGIGFEDPALDESAEQQAVAAHLGCRHQLRRVSTRDLLDAFDDALWHAELPVFRSAFVPMYLLSRELHSHGIKVVLTGEGADEALLGYNLFKELRIRRAWSGLDSERRREQLAGLYPYLRRGRTGAAQLAAVFDAASTPELRETPLFSHLVRFQNGRFTARLLAGEGPDPQAGLEAWLGATLAPNADPMQRAQWIEYSTLLHGYLLSTQGDRMAFAHSLETRLPFLDPGVVTLANRIAQDLKLTPTHSEKHVLKQAFGTVLPPQVIRRQKQPYRAPDAVAFLEHPDHSWRDLWNQTSFKRLPCLDPSFTRRFAERITAIPADRISQRENQTFLFLLSLLHLKARLDRFSPAGLDTQGIEPHLHRPTDPTG